MDSSPPSGCLLWSALRKHGRSTCLEFLLSERLTLEPCLHLLSDPDHAPTGANPIPPTLIRDVSRYPPAASQNLDVETHKQAR